MLKKKKQYERELSRQWFITTLVGIVGFTVLAIAGAYFILFMWNILAIVFEK